MVAPRVEEYPWEIFKVGTVALVHVYMLAALQPLQLVSLSFVQANHMTMIFLIVVSSVNLVTHPSWLAPLVFRSFYLRWDTSSLARRNPAGRSSSLGKEEGALFGGVPCVFHQHSWSTHTHTHTGTIRARERTPIQTNIGRQAPI